MARIKKGFLRITYRVSGKNINYLPEFLHRKNISVLEFSNVNENTSLVTIDAQDMLKFFAICKNMCYNKKAVKHRGILSPLTLFVNKVGFSIGTFAFVLFSTLLGNVCLGVKVQGSATAYERETRSIVQSLGVEKYALFKDIDCEKIEYEILSSNPHIAFVSVYKDGNYLVVDAQLSSSNADILGKNCSDVECTVDGVVEEITVLRGTPLVSVGDNVSKGDLLVGAYTLGKEDEKYPTFTVARVKIIQTVNYEHEGAVVNDREIELAYALAEFSVGGEIINKTHTVENGVIKVTLSVRHVISGG